MKIRTLEDYDYENCEISTNLQRIGGREGMCKHAQTVYKENYRNHAEKMRFESTDEGKLGKVISKAKKNGRKNNIKIEKIEKAVCSSSSENNEIEKKYPSQSKIGMPDRKTIRSVNKELKKVYGDKLK